MFDPVTETIINWVGGGGTHITGISQLTPAEVTELYEITSGLHLLDSAPDDEATSAVTTSRISERRTLMALEANGVRTTSAYPPGYSGNKLPITRIHEVWTSSDLNMVVRVIDGDPNGEETISGLEKVSLQPDPTLFQAPENNSIQMLSPEATPTYIRYFAEFFAD